MVRELFAEIFVELVVYLFLLKQHIKQLVYVQFICVFGKDIFLVIYHETSHFTNFMVFLIITLTHNYILICHNLVTRVLFFIEVCFMIAVGDTEVA